MRGAQKKHYGIQTGKEERDRKLVTNCKCSAAALSDRPIILLAHLEAMPS